jgi:hypothetical protein
VREYNKLVGENKPVNCLKGSTVGSVTTQRNLMGVFASKNFKKFFTLLRRRVFAL